MFGRIYEEVRVPFTSPTWNFWGFYSFEVDFAEREQWFSQNTSAVLKYFSSASSAYYIQRAKPKVSVRWQPVDPKYIGAVTLRGSYTEAFHAPTCRDQSCWPQAFPLVVDPFSSRLFRRSRNALPEIPSCSLKLPMNGLTERCTAQVAKGADGERRLVAHRHALPSLQRWDPSSLTTYSLNPAFASR